MKLYLSLGFVFSVALATAQSNVTCRWVKKYTEISQTIFWETISSKDTFQIDTLGRIIFDKDSIYICYRSLPKELSDTNQYYTNEQGYTLETYEDFERQENPENETKRTKLITQGAITRGIAVGNSAGNGVDSRLNLRVEGELTKGVYMKAYVSDQDIPIQPDGVTQNAQDLDRIYVSLYTKKKGLTLGDINLYDSTYFLRYKRNLQGLKIYTGSQSAFKTKMGIGISKGKFYSYQLPLRSGVLGPYKVEGPSTNKFTIMISGTEKIFLNGEQLIRGQDFTVDYNQSLVTFLPHILLTEYSRIRVDFEYSDLDYFRLNTNAIGEWSTKKLNLKVSYYNEKDNPNKPITRSSSQADISELSLIGDNTSEAFINSSRPATAKMAKI